ncbi:MAG: carboxymuconolactone decarboxylase family protein [Planctomycetes bacterium]|nr:carboxymuconolactone decarboxylase family protein [Planctomycetota bacterium]
MMENQKMMEAMKALHHKPGLEVRIRYLASIQALIALGEERRLHLLLDLALDEGICLTEIREIMLQGYPFCGFPRTINSFAVLHRCLKERGLTPEEMSPLPLDDRTPKELDSMGLDLFRQIYQYNHFEVLNTLKNDHPELPRWILRDVYGKVLTRPAVDPKTRELAAAAALTVLEVYPQLLSHIKGGLNLGADPREVREVIDQMAAFCPQNSVRKALRILRLGTSPRKGTRIEKAQ